MEPPLSNHAVQPFSTNACFHLSASSSSGTSSRPACVRCITSSMSQRTSAPIGWVNNVQTATRLRLTSRQSSPRRTAMRATLAGSSRIEVHQTLKSHPPSAFSRSLMNSAQSQADHRSLDGGPVAKVLLPRIVCHREPAIRTNRIVVDPATSKVSD
jgi:hypothetical protein